MFLLLKPSDQPIRSPASFKVISICWYPACTHVTLTPLLRPLIGCLTQPFSFWTDDKLAQNGSDFGKDSDAGWRMRRSILRIIEFSVRIRLPFSNAKALYQHNYVTIEKLLSLILKRD